MPFKFHTLGESGMTDANMVKLYNLYFALVSAFWLRLEALIQGDGVPETTIAATNRKKV